MAAPLRTLSKRFEDRALQLVRNALAFVLDGDEDPPVLRGDSNPDTCAGGCVPCGVGDEVLDDALNLRGVDGPDHFARRDRNRTVGTDHRRLPNAATERAHTGA